MKFKIHGTFQDGTTDTWIIEGETIEQIRAKAEVIIRARNLKDYFSERVE